MKKLALALFAPLFLTCSAFAQDTDTAPEPDANGNPNTEWASVAYLEFEAGTRDFLKELEGLSVQNASTTSTDSKEKTRVETLRTVDPKTGKTIIETETTRSAQASAVQYQPNRTSLITIESRPKVEGDKKLTDKEYRMILDGKPFLDIPEKDMKRAKKIAKDYLKAVSFVARGADANPYVSVVFGDKTLGTTISHQCRAGARDTPVKVRIWIKGKSFDLTATPAAAGFFSDIAAVK